MPLDFVTWLKINEGVCPIVYYRLKQLIPILEIFIYFIPLHTLLNILLNFCSSINGQALASEKNSGNPSPNSEHHGIRRVRCKILNRFLYT